MQNSIIPFQSVVGDRMANAVQPSFDDARQGAFGALMGQRHRQLEADQHGRQLSRFMQAPQPSGNSPIDAIHVRHKNPGIDIQFDNYEHQSNVIHPLNRNVKQMSDEFGCPEPYELLIMFRNEKARSNAAYLEDIGLFTESSPIDGFTPAVFNYVELMRQRALYDSDPTHHLAYMQQSPSEVWSHYAFQGAVETRMKTGMSSAMVPSFRRLDQDHSSYLPKGRLAYGNALDDVTVDGSRLMTVDLCGPAFVYNYWGSNIEPGGRLFAVIKKYPQPLDFRLRRGGGVLRDLAMQISVEQKHFFRPYQMGFYCLPPGTSAVPRELLTYVHDMGHMCYDGLPIFLGTIQSIPPAHKWQVQDLMHVRPYTGTDDQAYVESTHLMKVIWNTGLGGSFL